MADIVLKDRSGEPTTYSGATAVGLPQEDGTTKYFADCDTMRTYLAVDTGSGFRLVSRLALVFNNPFGSAAPISDTMCKEYGKLNNAGTAHILYVINTNKTVSEGNVYSLEYLTEEA